MKKQTFILRSGSKLFHALKKLAGQQHANSLGKVEFSRENKGQIWKAWKTKLVRTTQGKNKLVVVDIGCQPTKVKGQRSQKLNWQPSLGFIKFIYIFSIVVLLFAVGLNVFARDFQVKDASENTLFIIKEGAADYIGIGTANPKYVFDVWGGPIYIESSDFTQDNFAASVGYVQSAVTGGDNDWALVGGGDPTLTGDIYHTGSVGIGTTGPGAKLDVYTTSASSHSLLELDYDSPSQHSGNIIGLDVNMSAYGDDNNLWGIQVRMDRQGDPDGHFDKYGIDSEVPFGYTRNAVGIRGATNLTSQAGDGIKYAYGGLFELLGNDRTQPSYDFTALLARVESDQTTDINIFDARAGTSSKFIVKGSGNVGIGTTSPAAELDITADVNPIMRLTSLKDGTWNGYPNEEKGSLYFYSSDDNDGVVAKIAAVEEYIHGGWTALTFHTSHQPGGGGSSERMRINSDGNVGIGTTSPQADLHVWGSVKIKDDLDMPNADITANSVTASIFYDKDNVIYKLDPDSTTWGLYTQGSIYAGGTTNDNYFAGNVGIGIKEPSYKLDVSGTTRIKGLNLGLKIDGTRDEDNYGSGYIDIYHGPGGYNSSIYFKDAGTGTTDARIYTSNSNQLVFNNQANGYTSFEMNSVEKVRIDSNGNVGIGDTTPSYKLDVNNGAIHVGAPEILSNTGFESYTGTQDDGVTDTFSSWVRHEGTVDATATVHSGSNALKMVADSAYCTQGYFPVVAGKEYKVTFWQRGTGSADVNYAVYGSGIGYIISSTNSGNTSTTYKKVTFYFTAPAGCSLAKLYFFNSGYIDDVSVTLRYAGDGYFAGNVGIGTIIPKGKLDVAGGMSVGTYAGVNTPPSNGLIISGNVGIGATSPGGKLQVTGNVVFGNNANQGNNEGSLRLTGITYNDGLYGSSGKLIFHGTSNQTSNHRRWMIANNQNTADSGDLNFYVSTDANSDPTYLNSKVTFQSSGNVGIGATNPSYKLDVNGDISVSENNLIIHESGASELSGGGTVFFGRTASSAGDVAVGLNANSGNGANTGMFFPDRNSIAFSSKGAELFRINNGGNVGIGTTSPDNQLHVQGTGAQELKVESTDNHGLISISSNTNEGYDSYLTFQSADTTRGLIYYDHHTTAASQKMVFDVGDGAVTAMTILGNGNVGIGVTAPREKLEVRGKLVVSDATQPTIKLTQSATQDRWNIVYDPNGTLPLDFIAAGTDVMTLEYTTKNVLLAPSTGNVGIGTINPQAKLDVNGTIKVTNAGVTKITLDSSTGKITADEIDPIYKISGVKYATYGHSTTGLKEETTGKVQLGNQAIRQSGNQDKALYTAEIDFDEVEKAGDLWLFWQITAFGNDWEDLVVMLTSEGRADVWYELNSENNLLTIFGTRPVKVSYRLIAPRFDWPERDTNFADNPEVEGMLVDEKE